VRRVLDALALAHEQLVVDPAVRGMEDVRVGVVGRDDHVVRAVDSVEILESPRIPLDDRHASSTRPGNYGTRSGRVRSSAAGVRNVTP
jgi:hypothetical protein